MPNWENKTLFVGDNLHVMRGMDSSTVDLIYLDPPFNSNRTYSAPIGSQAAGAAFKDAWTLSDIDLVEHQALKQDHPSLFAVIDAAGSAHSKGMKSYLIMMAVRLLEMRRLLKDTGSLYLHCDDVVVHYLKLVMDAIFGAKQFRNNIVWRRATAHNDSKRFGRNLDHILYYSKGKNWTWNGTAIASPKSAEEIKRAFPQTDERGPVRSENLTGPLHGAAPGLPSTQPWKGYDVYAQGRCWSPPKTGAYAKYIEKHFIPNYRSIKGVQERLDALDEAGLIHHPTTGVWPGLKRYAAADQGNMPQSLILNPTGFTNYNKGHEWIGFPTQKPIALLDLFVRASSNPEDVVVDPFCGCATTLVAADRLRRQWIGVDLSYKAGELVKERIEADQKEMFRDDIQVSEAPPQRTDLGPPLKTAEKREYKKILYGLQIGRCNGCNVHFERLEHFHMDHISSPRTWWYRPQAQLSTTLRPLQQHQGNQDTSGVRRYHQSETKGFLMDVNGKQTKPKRGDKRNIPPHVHREAERVAKNLMLMKPKRRN